MCFWVLFAVLFWHFHHLVNFLFGTEWLCVCVRVGFPLMAYESGWRLREGGRQPIRHQCVRVYACLSSVLALINFGAVVFALPAT